MKAKLERTFDFLREVMPGEPSWRVIDSAALWLSRVPIVSDPPDVDVVAPSDVVEAIRKALGAPLTAQPRPDLRFRSYPFFQFTPDGGVPIDFMGDLEVCDLEWTLLRFKSCVSVGGVFLPSLEEQVDILRQFGRPKDLLRVQMVREYMCAK